jgi:hypothetical protein
LTRRSIFFARGISVSGRPGFARVVDLPPTTLATSQAGSQAIIDARALTSALLATSNPVEALERYDSERRPIMTDVTLRNRRFGPETAMQLVEERAPNGFARIEEVISREDLHAIAASFSSAAGLRRGAEITESCCV